MVDLLTLSSGGNGFDSSSTVSALSALIISLMAEAVDGRRAKRKDADQ